MGKSVRRIPGKWLSGSDLAFLSWCMHDWSLEELPIAWGLAPGTTLVSGRAHQDGSSKTRSQARLWTLARCQAVVPHNSGDSFRILKGQFLKGLETGGGGGGQQPQPMQWASIGKFQNGALLWGAGEAFLI